MKTGSALIKVMAAAVAAAALVGAQPALPHAGAAPPAAAPSSEERPPDAPIALSRLPGGRPVGTAPALGAQETGLRPLGELLQPDGSLDLNTGFRGPLDPAGWRMEYAADGAPRFMPAATPAADGAPRFEPAAAAAPAGVWDPLDPGLNGAVFAIAPEGPDVYVGGAFTDAGGVANADRIAVRTTGGWWALGSGLNGTVRTIAVEGTNVYVGGDFTDAGGIPEADHIARWDGGAGYGGSWHALGSGLNRWVAEITVVGPDLYVGGDFTDAGGIPEADYIARWDGGAGYGGSWQSVGGGLNGTVYAIEAVGPDLYVGGAFVNAGGVANAGSIARWDGGAGYGGSWNALGSGTAGSVSAIAVVGPDVYVGGTFTSAGGKPDTARIARWDGATWHALGWGLNARVTAIAIEGRDVYVSGAFNDAGGITGGDGIARWDGAWHALGNGLFGDVLTVAVEGPRVYVGGGFSNAGGNPNADCIVVWNAGDPPPGWSALGGGVNGTVWAVTVEGTNVYVGGDFTDAGGIAQGDHIARWDGGAGYGGSWHTLGSGLNGTVYAIAVAGPNVYAGGSFTDAGGNFLADRIARWDGSALTGGSWNALGSGVNDEVHAIAVAGPKVYVGGAFTNAGGNLAADYIACWDSAAWPAHWDSLGGGLNSTVTAIVVVGSDVYAGGWFTDAGGNPDADRIARWDGGAWNALGSGLNDAVYAVKEVGGFVYAGGGFTAAGGNPKADHVAVWSSYTGEWYALGSGSTGWVTAIAPVGSSLYVTGDFTDVTGNPIAGQIARFDGAYWHALDSGLSSTIRCLATSGPSLYAGGEFWSSGDISASRIARWGPLYRVWTPLVLR